MKKRIFFLLPLILLLASCSMEKRLYRNGWYNEKSHKTEHTFANSSKSDTITAKENPSSSVAGDTHEQAGQNGNVATPSNSTIENQGTVHGNPVKEAIELVRKKYTRKLNDPNRMTYAQARKQMADKGCKPNSLAMASYYTAFASVILLFFGIGLFVCLAALVIALIATNDVIEKGSCVEENLAIIQAAKRICYLELIYFAIAIILAFLIFLLFFSLVNVH